MAFLSLLPLLLAATTQAPPAVVEPVPPPVIDQYGRWNPAIGYVTAGQDEPGYRAWYLRDPQRAALVRSFNDYLVTYQVGGIIPTWQLLRTASDWQICASEPFALPPAALWPNIVQTLRFVHDRVIPVLGPVEAVSAYRDPMLNSCAKGAKTSAHLDFAAVDFVPLKPMSREMMIETLCKAHAGTGSPYGVGLGFYAYYRFHIDSRKFRKWGHGDGPEAAACIAEPPSMPIAGPLPPSASTQPVTPSH